MTREPLCFTVRTMGERPGRVDPIWTDLDAAAALRAFLERTRATNIRNWHKRKLKRKRSRMFLP